MLVSINLLGFFVRGLFKNPENEEIRPDDPEFIKQEIHRFKRANKWINIIAFLLIPAYLYILIHYWNIGVAAVAAALMLARLPDLIWEIRHGKKITFSITRSMPKNATYYITGLFDWAALPALYYFLYHF